MNKNWSADRKRIKDEKARLWAEQKREWERNRKAILKLRETKTLSEIAEIRGITRSRVIQILKYERDKGNGRSKDD